MTVYDGRRRRRSRRHPLAAMLTLWISSGGRCALCGFPMRPVEASGDHIVPLGAGGAHLVSNFQLAHRWCNNRRGDRALPAPTNMPRTEVMPMDVRAAGPPGYRVVSTFCLSGEVTTYEQPELMQAMGMAHDLALRSLAMTQEELAPLGDMVALQSRPDGREHRIVARRPDGETMTLCIIEVKEAAQSATVEQAATTGDKEP